MYELIFSTFQVIETVGKIYILNPFTQFCYQEASLCYVQILQSLWIFNVYFNKKIIKQLLSPFLSFIHSIQRLRVCIPK